MNRYFRLYRDSKKRLFKMETILEEVYVTEKEPGPVEPDWKKIWFTVREIESHWDQWVDIEYMDEPLTPPPAIR